MDDILSPPEKQYDTAPLLIQGRDQLSKLFHGCDHAQTMVAYLMPAGDQVLIPLPCKQWSCRHCAEVRIRRLAAMTRDAEPNRLLTLTVNPERHATPRTAFDETRRQIPVFFGKLRKRFGEIEYLRCTELHRSGYPHYHFLLRSAYLPHQVVKDTWSELTGAWIVDVRQVRQGFKAYWYLVKYLSKLHDLQWTNRHVAYSRHFFRPDPRPEKEPMQLEKTQVINEHPVTYCLSLSEGCQLQRMTTTMWRVLSPNETEEF